MTGLALYGLLLLVLGVLVVYSRRVRLRGLIAGRAAELGVEMPGKHSSTTSLLRSVEVLLNDPLVMLWVLRRHNFCCEEVRQHVGDEGVGWSERRLLAVFWSVFRPAMPKPQPWMLTGVERSIAGRAELCQRDLERFTRNPTLWGKHSLLDAAEVLHTTCSQWGVQVPAPLRRNNMLSWMKRQEYRVAMDAVKAEVGRRLTAGEPVPEEWFARLLDWEDRHV